MNQYREGKVKSTPGRGVKESLNPYAYKRSEQLMAVTACLLHNELRVAMSGEVKRKDARSRSESESE